MTCAFCRNDDLTEVMDFGRMALAGGFLRLQDAIFEREYPLRLMFCGDCSAVQLADAVPPSLMFGNYFYFSSAIPSVCQHADDYAATVMRRFNPQLALEVGCNDGAMIRSLVKHGIGKVIGVDPAANVMRGIDHAKVRTVNEYFTVPAAQAIAAIHGKVDVVIANNVMAHITDIHGATAAVREVMRPDGTFIMEAHYLGAMVDKLQYDWIYHEHLYYYSAIALKNHFDAHGMTIFDAEPVATHGGSMRYFVCNAGERDVSQRMKSLLVREKMAGLNRAETFTRFAERVAAHKAQFVRAMQAIADSGALVAGYGASGRANTLLQYCDIGRDHLAFMVDDAPAKTGYYTPGTHLPIYRNDLLQAMRPDYVLVTAWPYLDEIAPKCGDADLIVPLPDIRRIAGAKVSA